STAAGRIMADQPAGRRRADARLTLHGRTIERAQVSMGRRRGEDLDVARLREIRERADEVPTKTRSVCLSQPAVRADVEARELRAALIRRFRKAANVVLGSRDLVVDVFERADVDV